MSASFFKDLDVGSNVTRMEWSFVLSVTASVLYIVSAVGALISLHTPRRWDLQPVNTQPPGGVTLVTANGTPYVQLTQ